VRTFHTADELTTTPGGCGVVPAGLISARKKGRDITMMNRRTFSTAMLAGAAVSLISTRGMAANAIPPKARNIVLVHGLFADGRY
jgi:hypothetical protein